MESRRHTQKKFITNGRNEGFKLFWGRNLVNSLIIVDFSHGELSLVGLRSGRVLICIISLVQIPD
jgi:hypothetical protein